MSNDAVLLYDLSGDSITKLDAARNGVANAGAVNGDWVTWQKCGPSACKVFRHQPSTGITTRLRTAGAAFAPGVDASDLYIHEHAGVVDLYFSRVTCQDFDFDVYRVSGA